MDHCRLCGNPVPTEGLLKHLEADVWMLGVINAVYPDIGHKGCKTYLEGLRCLN
jgi:hypothetical protein